MELKHIIGSLCVAAALFFDILGYWRQARKIIKEKHSNQVSSTSYLYKVLKGLLAVGGLIIFSNWVGLGMEVVLIIVYIVSLFIIVRYKPKGWKMFK